MKRKKREKRARDYFELEPDERILREYKEFLGEPILLTNKQIYYRKGILFKKPCKVPYRGITGISAVHLEPYYSPFPLDRWNIYLFENSGKIPELNTYVEKEFKDDLVKDVLEARRDLVPKKDISPEIRVRETELSDKIVEELHGDNLVDLTGPGYYCGRKKGG